MPPAGDGLVALLFTDLVGGTELLDRLGDEAAERLRRMHFALLREAVAECRGQEVKNLGDGLMVVFPSAVDAVSCAIAVQRAVERHNAASGEPGLHIRVGLHAGEPMRDEGDFFGTPVVLAKRLCDAAAGGQILASELVRGLIGSRAEPVFSSVGRLRLKGLKQTVAAFEVAWGSHEQTPRTPRNSGVLRSRLLPPRPPPGALDRPRLRERLSAGLNGRLVLVVAGAGYGKSTLLAQALAGVHMPSVWLSCDERIGSANALLAHLAAGLRQRFPGVGAQLVLEGALEEQANELCNEVAETLSDDFVLALDDVHTLLGGPAADAIGLLLSDLPPNVHLAMTSRVVLPFTLGRARAAGVLQLGEEALAFDEHESAALLRANRRELAPRAVRDLHRRTEGWVTGLLLSVQPGSALSTPALLGAEGPHFDYLASEVVERLPELTQRFLRETAVLERFSPELAEAVTGRAETPDVIDHLVSSRLFIIRLEAEGEWYRYHHLFQAFLRRKSRLGRDRLRELHRRAADWWLDAGEVHEAVHHLIEAGEHSAAVDALEPVAETMVGTPEAEVLADWLDALPPALWANRPRLVLAQAALLLTRAQHEASFAASERAIDQLLEAGDHERAAAAWVRLQQGMVTAGTRPTRRIESGRRYARRIDPRAAMFAFGRIFLATSYAYGGRFDEARAELEAAVREPAAAGSPLLGPYAGIARSFYIDFWLGSPEDALAVFDESVAVLQHHEAEDVLGFLAYARMLRLYLLNALGRYEEALSDAERTEQAFGRRGIRRAPARVMPWVRSLALAGLGRWDQFAQEYVPPPQAADPRDVISYSYRYRIPAARLAAQEGRTATVRAQVAASREEMTAFGEAFDQWLFLSELACAAWDAGLADLARDVADDALRDAEAIGLWPRALASLVGALVHGAGEIGDRLLATALTLTSENALGFLWTRRERARSADLLLRALERGVGPPGVSARLLAECGGAVFAEVLRRVGDPEVRAELAELAGGVPDMDIAVVDQLLRDRDPAVRDAARRSWTRLTARPRAAIRLITLGRLQVLRDGVPVPDSVFRRQKARALLAALVAAGGPVHREALTEWLWPELPPARAAAALRTTLHDLRRALEPEFEPGSPSSLVASDGEMIRLDLGERDSWDGEDLIEAARPAPDAHSEAKDLERLLAAEALYTGPFLQEWPYEDWARTRREEFAQINENVLVRLAEALMAAAQPASAIPRLRRLVAADPESESWHRALMRAYAQAGDRALALRQYHACRAVLRREQGIEPGASTRALYQALLTQEEPERAPVAGSVSEG